MDATRRLTQSRPQQPTAPQLADQTNLLGRSSPALSLATPAYGVHREVICVIAMGLLQVSLEGPASLMPPVFSTSSPQSIRVVCSRASVRNDSRCVPRCIITGLYMYDVYEESRNGYFLPSIRFASGGFQMWLILRRLLAGVAALLWADCFCPTCSSQ
jgi:hypothetical protein